MNRVQKFRYVKGRIAMNRIKLLLVEDEPAALTILEKVIRKVPVEIEIIGKAKNGLEAKQLIEAHREIDVVITDIKMPLMDGLALSKYIYQAEIDMEIVIVSGFQEFTFAQKAIQYGVEDYILKPLIPANITEVLARLAAKRRIKKQEQERKLLERSLKSSSYTENIEGRTYQVLTLHLGSFNGLVVEDAIAVESKIAAFEEKQTFVFNGRKKHEFVCIFPAVGQLAEKIQWLQKEFAEYSYLLLYATKACGITQLNTVHGKMSRLAELYHRIGQQQSLSFENTKDILVSQEDSLNWRAYHVDLEETYLKGNWAGLRQQLTKIIQENLAEVSTLQLLNRGNQLISFFNQHLESTQQINHSVFEDVLLSTTTLNDVLLDFEELITHFLKESTKYPEKIDSYEFYKLVKNFVCHHYARFDLNLSLISNHFGISVTSINDLFKKYQQQTFKDFLLQLRMEQAVAKMKQSPLMNLREIAEGVGYKDALYFSKVFKKQYGKSPSLFQEEIRKLGAPS